MNNKKLYSAYKRIYVKFLFYLIIFYPLLSTSAQSWQAQFSGVDNSLRSVFFTDEHNGWAVGSFGAVVHTTNGGENWNQQSSGSNKDLNCVHFIDSITGWICGSQGTILKTTDGGNSWSPQNSATVFNLLSVHFANDSVGWVVGTNGTISKTTNGGTNWITQNSPFTEVINDVDFVDDLYGWAATFESGSVETTIIKTTDGGDFWELVTLPMLIPLPVFSVDFIDRNTGWVVGYLEIIYKSIDGGYNWFEQQLGLSSTPEGFLSVSFADENNGWTVGYDGVIGHTSDGGDHWTAQSSGTSDILWDVYIVNPNAGWIVGDNGLILKYTTTVSVNEDESALDEFILNNNYPNPFNPITNIQFRISNFEFVSLKVYDVLGNLVATLVNEEKPVGVYEVEFDATKLTSGIYFYQLKSGSFIKTKKMIFIK